MNVVQILGKAILTLKLRQGRDGRRQPTIADSEPIFLAHLNHHFVVDELIERLFSQSFVVDQIGPRGVTEKSQQLVALLLVEATELARVQLDSVDRRNGNPLTGRHVVVHAPQRKRNGYQRDDRPRDPSRRAITNGLEHRLLGVGGADGTRTRDLRRDRPAF